MVLPYFLSDLLKKWISSYTVRIIIEGIIRIAIFVAYVGGISVMNDIKRLYRYHGAEHKCINCIEHGLPLTCLLYTSFSVQKVKRNLLSLLQKVKKNL